MEKKKVAELRIRILPLEGKEETGCRLEASVEQGTPFPLQPVVWNATDFQLLEGNAWAYGQKLGELLFADIGLRSALDFAMGQSNGHVRMRLEIDERCKPAQSILWERAMYRRGSEDLMLAADEKVFLSRTVPRPPDAVTGEKKARFRLVLAIATPVELPTGEGSGQRAIDTEQTASQLIDAMRPLVERGQLALVLIARVTKDFAEKMQVPGVEIPNKAATLDAISDAVQSADGLHLICHGGFDSKKTAASLLLEDPDGNADLTGEAEFLGRLPARTLKLLFLQSCESAKRPRADADLWSGLAPKAARKFAAVIAMQDKIRIDEAERFARAMYRTLLQCGHADEAVNAGRREIRSPGSGSWAIPALYLDPRTVIWEPDPLLDAVHELAARFRRLPEVDAPFPVDLIRQSAQTTALTETGPAGPRMPVIEAVKGELSDTTLARRTLVLVGNFGRAKTAQLYRIYCELAKESAGGKALPLFLRLSGFRDSDVNSEETVAAAIGAVFQSEISRTIETDHIIAQLSQPVTLLLDADDGAGKNFREFAFSKIEDIQARNPGASVIVTMDEQNFESIRGACPKLFDKAAIFYVQLLSQSALYQYLSSSKPARADLYNSIASSNLFDVAQVPWLLSHLLRPGASAPKSRATVVDRIAAASLDVVSREQGVYKMVRKALGETAWVLNTCQRLRVSGAEFQRILREVRDDREVGIEVLRSAALATRILVQSEEDCLRFAYPGFQSLWCAHFLLSDPAAFERRLGDITATLGRRSRVVLWEDTLVLLTGLMPEPELLLRRILAGSGLSHGEQIYVACRCIHEARQVGKAVPEDILAQVCDNLIRQSHARSGLQSSLRIKAIQTLGLLQAKDAIPHLVSVAADRLRVNAEGQPEFEYSGMRQAAISALLGMQEQTQKHLQTLAARDETKEKGQALLDLMKCWQGGDVEQIKKLATGDSTLAPVSALILGNIGGADNLKFLIELATSEKSNSQTRWAVTDALLQFHPREVTEQAVSRMREISALAAQCAYLIGRLGVALPGSPELEHVHSSLLASDARTRGMALRSLAQLGSGDHRVLCEQIVAEDWAGASEALKAPFEVRDKQRNDLVYYALESLKLIGTEDSIDVLRKARCANRGREVSDRLPDWITDLSYQTGEEIYWRLTRGMEGDSFGPPNAEAKTKEE